VDQAVGEDAAADAHQSEGQAHLEHAGCVGHHLVELVGDAHRPAEVPGHSGEFVRKVRHYRDGNRDTSPAAGRRRRGPAGCGAVASAAGDARVAAAAVVRDRGRGPEQAADENDDEVHAVPVEDVADAVL